MRFFASIPAWCRYRLDRHFRLASRMAGKAYLPMRSTDPVTCQGSSDAIPVNKVCALFFLLLFFLRKRALHHASPHHRQHNPPITTSHLKPALLFPRTNTAHTNPIHPD